MSAESSFTPLLDFCGVSTFTTSNGMFTFAEVCSLHWIGSNFSSMSCYLQELNLLSNR